MFEGRLKMGIKPFELRRGWGIFIQPILNLIEIEKPFKMKSIIRKGVLGCESQREDLPCF